ncbi:hypothetical protein SEA_JUSTBECAUSE_327 [Streptomyces phage JustBecause]|nr:hypothetical protein SEA_JUSTBECAUSE_327 [Streptomyces phage JustBecause]
MGRTVAEFHGLLADLLINARRKHDGRPGLGEPGYLGQESQDAVTMWRHMAHMAHSYANGADVRGARPTWSDLWEDGMDRGKFLALITERSRILRAVKRGGDMDTTLMDDSVRYWEYSLALSTVTNDDHAESARQSGNREAARRITLETEIDLALIRAYTDVDIATLRRTLRECKSERPTYPGVDADGNRKWEPHPLFDLITANRPTV